MNIKARAICAVLGLSVAACGGGGDDGGNAAAVAATKNVAINGVAVSFIAGRSAVAEWGIVAGTLAGLSFYPGSAQGIDVSGVCTSGSASADIVKAGTYAGFAAGDKAVVNFRKCAISPTVSVDGSVASTILVPFATPIGTNYALRARFEPKIYSVTDGAVVRRYLGATEFSLTSSSGPSYDAGLSIPSGSALTVEISGNNARVSYSYLAGTTYRGSDTSTSFSRKLDGTISLVPVGAPPATLTVDTPTAFAGTPRNGILVASQGVMNAREKTDATGGVSSAVTVSGAEVRVDGDINLDGALDVSFGTTWSELLGL